MAKRGPYRKGEAKRAEILTAALEIFATEGYRGTSLRKVAAQCGLSLPGIMHYFASKEDLLTQVLRMRDRTERARHPDFHMIDDTLDIVLQGMRTPGLVELFVSMAASAGDTSHPAHEFFQRRYTVYREAIARRLAEEQTAIPPERAAVLLLAVVDGVQLQWLADQSIDMREPVADALRLLGIGPG
ncbi:MAG: TetR family transcriptional regulator [Nonomuraea sp.]|nr:TetR family transcriptional regulator [Nonomuraea sp.]